MTIDPRTQALNNPFVPNAAPAAAPVVASPSSSTGATNLPTMNPLPGGAAQPVQPNDPPSAANGYIANSNTLTTVGAVTDDALMSVLEDTAYQQPNALSAFRQATYRWRFFMTTEHDLVQGASVSSVQALYSTLDGIPQVTIAESGVTAGFNITSVEMEQACGPSFRSRSSAMSGFTINIVEPLGSNLIESIVNSSMSLGVQNFTKMWYYLELTFQGYDDDGTIDESPLDDMNLDNGGRWVYPIAVTNVDMRLDESGAHYEVKANPFTMAAFETTGLGTIPDKLNVTGATILDFMNDFCKKLQASYKTRYLAEIYKFSVVIDPIEDDGRNPGTFKLSQGDNDSVRNLSLDVTGGRAPTANIARGTSINDVVIFLYAHCEEAQAMMLDTNIASALEDGSSGSGAVNSSATATFNNKPYRVPIVPVIEPEVKVFGYDPVTGVYMKEITYHIRSYRNYTANLTASQYGNIKKDPRVATTIIADLKKRNFLRKAYYYRFTGLNTEVIKVDPASFNFSFQAVLPRISGWAQDTPSVSQHEKANPATIKAGGSLANQTNETSSSPAQLSASQLASANATATGSQLNNDNANIDSIQSQLQQQFGGNNALTTNDPSTGKPYTAAQQAQYQQLQTQLASANSDKASLASAAQAERDQANQTAAARRQQIEAAGATNTFAEDASMSNSVFQLSYVQGNDESSQAIGKGFTGQWHRGASLVGALMNQLYQTETDGLQQITLEIRGDPYWLGASALERRAVMNGAPPQNNSVLPNWTSGDSTFALILKFPNGIDSNGAPVMRNDDVFNGMYRVTNVKSRFADGQFTQTLTSNKLEIITALDGGTGSNPGNSGGTTPTSGTAPAG